MTTHQSSTRSLRSRVGNTLEDKPSSQSGKSNTQLDTSPPGVGGQKFTRLDREWPTSGHSWSSIHDQRHNQDGEIPLEMAGSGARDMTPTERWMKEGGKESPWNNVGSYSMMGTKDRSGKDKRKS